MSGTTTAAQTATGKKSGAAGGDQLGKDALSDPLKTPKPQQVAKSVVSTDVDDVMDPFKAGEGEQVVVLETSTSTTNVGSKVYFEPNTLYSFNLDLNFFRELASPQGTPG